MTCSNTDFVYIRNIIRRQIKRRMKAGLIDQSRGLADVTQDALALCWCSIERGTDTGLAIWRAVRSVSRGRSFIYAPALRERWEESDPTGFYYLKHGRPTANV